MQAKKNKNTAVILGVAFVWFTTHFGGGFASGAQIYSYFVKYGIACLILPVLAMVYNGIFLPTVSALQESMKYMITGPITMLFTGGLPRCSPTCLRSSISV